MMPAALTRRNGVYIWREYIWREGDDAKTIFRAVDGTEVEASGFRRSTSSVWRLRPVRPTSNLIWPAA